MGGKESKRRVFDESGSDEDRNGSSNSVKVTLAAPSDHDKGEGSEIHIESQPTTPSHHYQSPSVARRNQQQTPDSSPTSTPLQAKRKSRKSKRKKIAQTSSFVLILCLVALIAVLSQRSLISKLYYLLGFPSIYNKFDPNALRYTYVQKDGTGAVVLSPLCLAPVGKSMLEKIGSSKRNSNGVRLLVPTETRSCASIHIHGMIVKVDSSTTLCEKYEKATLQRANLPLLESEPMETLLSADRNGRIAWIREDTLIMQFEKEGSVDKEGWFEQAAMISHVKNNPSMYKLSGTSVNSMILLFNLSYAEEFRRENPFLDGILASAIYPGIIDRKAPFNVMMPGIIRARDGTLKTITDELLHSANGGSDKWNRVCFKNAILPSRLMDKLYTGNQELWYSTAENTGNSYEYYANKNIAPRDWEFFRKQTFSRLGLVTNVQIERKVVYIRRNKTRILDSEGETKLLEYMNNLASRYTFDVRVLDFDSLSFDAQVKVTHTASILVGIHGHNLLHSYFMQPRTALVEILPYAFTSRRYVEGVARRLRYYAVPLSSGNDTYYPGLSQFYGDKPRCMRESLECLSRFRYDFETMNFTNGDAEHFRNKFSRALIYAQQQFFPE
eukprot:CAMPEP_0182451944 /NCGR_PEP_ID=MMETSP1172-20130603/43990_1 /TAXON_ID=708627 /ORGANISM="Timspurckia oligopyrenoides, Strain CCMP3278" /LENGTH=611 /DNA_ID=CAMNT_0024649751 /DNA_START=1559 /DNA_END=3394 /DNA_ORIENTATION=+